MSNRDRRQERAALSSLNPMYSPATTATKLHPHHTNPAIAIPIFKTQYMLIGR